MAGQAEDFEFEFENDSINTKDPNQNGFKEETHNNESNHNGENFLTAVNNGNPINEESSNKTDPQNNFTWENNDTIDSSNKAKINIVSKLDNRKPDKECVLENNHNNSNNNNDDFEFEEIDEKTVEKENNYKTHCLEEGTCSKNNQDKSGEEARNNVNHEIAEDISNKCSESKGAINLDDLNNKRTTKKSDSNKEAIVNFASEDEIMDNTNNDSELINKKDQFEFLCENKDNKDEEIENINNTNLSLDEKQKENNEKTESTEMKLTIPQLKTTLDETYSSEIPKNEEESTNKCQDITKEEKEEGYINKEGNNILNNPEEIKNNGDQNDKIKDFEVKNINNNANDNCCNKELLKEVNDTFEESKVKIEPKLNHISDSEDEDVGGGGDTKPKSIEFSNNENMINHQIEKILDSNLKEPLSSKNPIINENSQDGFEFNPEVDQVKEEFNSSLNNNNKVENKNDELGFEFEEAIEENNNIIINKENIINKVLVESNNNHMINSSLYKEDLNKSKNNEQLKMQEDKEETKGKNNDAIKVESTTINFKTEKTEEIVNNNNNNNNNNNIITNDQQNKNNDDDDFEFEEIDEGINSNENNIQSNERSEQINNLKNKETTNQEHLEGVSNKKKEESNNMTSKDEVDGEFEFEEAIEAVEETVINNNNQCDQKIHTSTEKPKESNYQENKHECKRNQVLLSFLDSYKTNYNRNFTKLLSISNNKNRTKTEDLTKVKSREEVTKSSNSKINKCEKSKEKVKPKLYSYQVTPLTEFNSFKDSQDKVFSCLREITKQQGNIRSTNIQYKELEKLNCLSIVDIISLKQFKAESKTNDKLNSQSLEESRNLNRGVSSSILPLDILNKVQNSTIKKLFYCYIDFESNYNNITYKNSASNLNNSKNINTPEESKSISPNTTITTSNNNNCPEISKPCKKEFLENEDNNIEVDGTPKINQNKPKVPAKIANKAKAKLEKVKLEEDDNIEDGVTNPKSHVEEEVDNEFEFVEEEQIENTVKDNNKKDEINDINNTKEINSSKTPENTIIYQQTTDFNLENFISQSTKNVPVKASNMKFEEGLLSIIENTSNSKDNKAKNNLNNSQNTNDQTGTGKKSDSDKQEKKNEDELINVMKNLGLLNPKNLVNEKTKVEQESLESNKNKERKKLIDDFNALLNKLPNTSFLTNKIIEYPESFWEIK